MLSYPRTDDLFKGGAPPSAWFYAFEEDPTAAVQDLLLGAADLGPFQTLDPWAVALPWLQAFSDASFPADFDAALSEWIVSSWGQPIHPASYGSAALTARAWEAVSLIIANFDGLPTSAGILRGRVLANREFLASMGEGPSLDPAGRAWQALAQYQEDDSLFEEWQRILALDPGVPWYHGQYGLMGVDLLPGNRGATGIPPPLAYGLRRYGNALLKLVTDGYLNERIARREFERLSRWAQSRYPFKGAWRSVWRQLIEHENDPLAPWVFDSLGVDHGARNGQVEQDRWQLPSASGDWFGRVQQIRPQLKRPSPAVLDAANTLLSEMEVYYHATGDSYNFVRTACNFETVLPEEWIGSWIPWLEKAMRFDPADPYPATQLADALLEIGKLREAEQAARWGIYHFPLDMVAFNVLGHVLTAAGKLGEAESVYRDAALRFPGNVVARNGLGDVLRLAGKLDEAESVYRETMDRHPNREDARNGLGEVLKTAGKLAEAEGVYRETADRFPKNVIARNCLGEILKDAGKLDEAEIMYRETIRRSNDVIARNGLGDVLRLAGNLDEAESMYRATMLLHPNRADARNGLVDVLRAAGRLAEAESLNRETVQRFPRNRYAARRLESIDSVDVDIPDFDGEPIPYLDIELVPEFDAESIPNLEEAGTVRTAPSEGDESPSSADERSPGSEDPDKASSASDAFEGAPQWSSASDGSLTRLNPLPGFLRATDIDVLIQDSHLLRKWARGTGDEAMSHIREEARSLLSKLERFVASSPAAVMESSLLLIETEDIHAALRLLDEAATRYPGSKRVQYALARTRREAARQARKDSHPFQFGSPDAVGIPRAWAQLLQLEPVLLPSARLGLVRSLPYLTDGLQLSQAQRSGLGQLAHALHSLQPSSDTRNPRSYWAYRVGELVLGGRAAEIRGASELTDDDIDQASKRCEENLLILNGLEEDLLLHYHVS